jgi:hypothetical protein
MVNKFMEKLGAEMPEGAEEAMKKAQEWGFGGARCGGGGAWKKQRALLISKPNGVLEASPGQMLLPSIEMKNGTAWAWKQGCFLGMDESVDIAALPIEVVNVPINFDVKGHETFKIQVPIKVLDIMIPDKTEYEFSLCFRGPNGNQFGEPIPMKIKVVPNQSEEKDEIEFYKLAIKLHD